MVRRIAVLAGLVALAGATGCEVVLSLDRPDGTARCDRSQPFGDGTKVPIAGDWSVEGARFRDSSRGYLSLCEIVANDLDATKKNCDLYAADFDAGFKGLIEMDISAAGEYDSYPTFNADFTLILWGSGRNSGGVHIFYARDDNGVFSGTSANQLALPPPVGENDPLANTNEPYFTTDDGSTMYFGGDRGDFDWDLYRATGTPPDYDTVERLANVFSTKNEFAPVVSRDELELFFGSNRLVNRDDPDLDLYRATRTSTDEDFGAPVRLDISHTGETEFPLYISDDGCDLYYVNRPGDVGSLMVASRR